MLFHVSGKLADNRPFSIRVDSDNALDATATVKTGLQKEGVNVNAIRQIVTKPVKESAGLYIGEARAPRKRAAKGAVKKA